ncbi:MAG TPA: cytochrome P450, partial [Blastocatellia bacterium]|nr:cytochrome P450 [Blastocatellia bacterium]
IYLLNDPVEIQNILVTNNKQFKKSRGLQVAKRFLGEGLLTSEGDFHRRQRRLVQPAFHVQRIESYAREMARQAERVSEGWKDGQQIDMLQEMMLLTLAVVARTLFDADVDHEASEIRDAINRIMHLFTFTLTLPFADLIERVLVFPKRRFERARARLDAVIYRIIREHREAGTDRGDLLSMLLLSRDEETDNAGMTDQQVRDESMTLFLAGHETTANALTWTWYLLSQYPEVEAKLHAEIASVLGDRLPSAQDVKKLPYTEMVLSESMRLYPPAWTLGREALEDYRIKNQTLPKSSIVLMSQYVTHRDPRFFPEPDRFIPERWTPEAIALRPRFSYFPFGGGPRLCIGEPFAWMEGTILLAAIARKWKARLVPSHRVEMEPLITLRPKHGMPMTLTRRPVTRGVSDQACTPVSAA